MGRRPRTQTLLPEAQCAEINAHFAAEAAQYGLIYRCQRCIHYVPGTGACSLRYPNHMLAQGDVRALDETGQFVFCKDFELGD